MTPQEYFGNENSARFLRSENVEYDSVGSPRDLGEFLSANQEIRGTVGDQTGTATIFFRFRTRVATLIRLALLPVNRYTDKSLQLSMIDPERRSLRLSEDDGSPLLRPAGEYTIVLACSAWTSTRYRLGLSVTEEGEVEPDEIVDFWGPIGGPYISVLENVWPLTEYAQYESVSWDYSEAGPTPFMAYPVPGYVSPTLNSAGGDSYSLGPLQARLQRSLADGPADPEGARYVSSITGGGYPSTNVILSLLIDPGTGEVASIDEATLSATSGLRGTYYSEIGVLAPTVLGQGLDPCLFDPGVSAPLTLFENVLDSNGWGWGTFPGLRNTSCSMSFSRSATRYPDRPETSQAPVYAKTITRAFRFLGNVPQLAQDSSILPGACPIVSASLIRVLLAGAPPSTANAYRGSYFIFEANGVPLVALVTGSAMTGDRLLLWLRGPIQRDGRYVRLGVMPRVGDNYILATKTDGSFDYYSNTYSEDEFLPLDRLECEVDGNGNCALSLPYDGFIYVIGFVYMTVTDYLSNTPWEALPWLGSAPLTTALATASTVAPWQRLAAKNPRVGDLTVPCGALFLTAREGSVYTAATVAGGTATEVSLDSLEDTGELFYFAYSIAVVPDGPGPD